ncbi:MAG: AsnC family transcriptional regulator [archaeon GB-1867-035]|nr:AsnC family transcriptional regulator [Candidatus Culexmicrobium profundum]
MSWKMCPHFRKYVKAIDNNCIKIIRSLNRVKSRNLSLVARETEMPPALVHYYYDKLARRGILKLNVDINLEKLGLTPVVIMAKPFYNAIDQAEKALKTIDYWREISRCYLSDQTYYYCYYAIPTEKKRLFENFIKELKQRKIIDKLQVYWKPRKEHSNPNFQWFDTKNKQWNFEWNEWIEEVLTYVSSSPKEVSIEGALEKESYAPLDEADFFILRKIEEDTEVTFKDLALMLGVTPPTIRYHYYKHLVNYGIIRGYKPSIYPYPKQFAHLSIVKIKFDTPQKLEAFIKSLEEKPFVQQVMIYEKELLLLMKTYILIDQLPGFIRALTQLHAQQVVSKYSWCLIDPEKDWEQLLPAKLYVKGKWQYPHENYIKALDTIKQ